VPAGHGQVQALDPDRLVLGEALFLDHHVEAAAVGRHLAVVGPDHGLRVDAIGHQPPVIDRGHQPLHLGVVEADGGEAVEGDVLDEVHERLPHPVEVAVVVQMLGVDVGDDGHRRLQAQEAAVALVGLDHDPVAVADLGVGAVGVDDAAVDHRRDPARRRREWRRPWRSSWSCRGCRRPRSRTAAASVRPASRPGEPAGCGARGPRSSRGWSP
jgi:hypothetical protein